MLQQASVNKYLEERLGHWLALYRCVVTLPVLALDDALGLSKAAKPCP